MNNNLKDLNLKSCQFCTHCECWYGTYICEITNENVNLEDTCKNFEEFED